jgi:hypothetical protein
MEVEWVRPYKHLPFLDNNKKVHPHMWFEFDKPFICQGKSNPSFDPFIMSSRIVRRPQIKSQ